MKRRAFKQTFMTGDEFKSWLTDAATSSITS